MAVNRIAHLMRPRSAPPDFLIWVENPITHIYAPGGGRIYLPSFRAGLDLNELAKWEWVWMLRMMLLFIIIWKFISAVIVALRQG